MTTQDDLCFMTATEAIDAFKARTLSPVELLQAQIKRIEKYNPLVNAITYKHFDQAMAEADLAAFRFAYEWDKLSPRPYEDGRLPIFRSEP